MIASLAGVVLSALASKQEPYCPRIAPKYYLKNYGTKRCNCKYVEIGLF